MGKAMIVRANSEYSAYMKLREQGFKPYAVRCIFMDYYKGYSFEECLKEGIF